MMTEKEAMKLLPLWIAVLLFASALIEGFYPTVHVIETLSQPWVETLLVAMGLGGIPLSVFKRVIAARNGTNIPIE